MVKNIVLCTALVLSLAAAASAAGRLKVNSPGPGMHFTAGLPLQVWADMSPRDDKEGWPAVECYWDGQQIGQRVLGNLKGYDYFPFTVPADLVKPGEHKLMLKGFVRTGGDPLETTSIVQVDEWPADKKVVELKEDAEYTDLDWTNVAVRGNGHTVKVSGKLTIKNSLITGLGSLKIDDPSKDDPKNVVMVRGITGTLTGDVKIEDSIFEATGALGLTINGKGAVSIRNNEFRASNFIKFVPNNPDASPVIEFSGDNATHKLFQGNRIASGRVVFISMRDWLIGTGEDQNEPDGNILIGPRCTINVPGCSHITIRGNYSHHNYLPEWSQGFNFVYGLGIHCGQGILTEHNLLRGGSWLVQDLSGEFRYNLIVGYGHEWIRTVADDASIHHNVFVPVGPGQYSYGIWVYQKAKGIKIYNNTFDTGGKIGDAAGPFVGITGPVEVLSLRNNVFTYARDQSNGTTGLPLVKVGPGSLLYADYNAFYSPDSKQTKNYDLTIADKKVGDAGFGGHDVSGAGKIGVVDGRLDDHPFAGKRMLPYTVDEAAVWNRKLKLSEVLADFRERYAPAPGSPLIDKGDPADGEGVDIGAIEAAGGTQRPEDLFGKFGKTGKSATTSSRPATAPAKP